MTSTISATDVSAIVPLDRRAAVELGRVEYQRLAEDLRSLHPGDWERPTDCTGWTVRDLAGHLVGAMRAAASIRESLSQQRATALRAKERGELQVDAMTGIQKERAASLTPAEVMAEIERLVQPAASGRRHPPEPIARLVRFRVQIGSSDERWTLSYLNGTVLTRDTWLHRVDLARAVGRELPVVPDHDGRIIVDVVGEWARRHGQPFDLTLTGPAGGRFSSGAGGPALQADAVEFCRMLSGRAEPTHELFEQSVPF